MSQRLTRKQIKRDQVMETLGSLFDYTRGHLRTLIAALVAILVLMAMVVAWRGYAQAREDRASAKLGEAVRIYRASIDPIAPDPGSPTAPVFANESLRDRAAEELLETLISDFEGTDSADIAKAYLAEMAARAGDSDSARSLWQEFLQSQGDHMLAAEAQVNLMVLDREEGKGQELAERLRSMLSEPGQDLPEDLLLYQLALTLEALGQKDAANETLQRLAEEHPQSVYSAAARVGSLTQ
jgi:tetratricopeptide (TPR) repeat protein